MADQYIYIYTVVAIIMQINKALNTYRGLRPTVLSKIVGTILSEVKNFIFSMEKSGTTE
jgi:mannose/fructose/N-acetylgalactosamine-specific phosphotransferase system component IIC